MPEIKKGAFTLDLGVFKMHVEVTEEDRQCAWELYTELCTRLALVGKASDEECKDFEGEVLAESLDSVYRFFQEARGIMRKFPVGRLKENTDKHLGLLINELMVKVLRPFLEKWQADYRHWWKEEADQKLSPFERQKNYPHYDEMLADWTDLRLLVRELLEVLVDTYKLTKLQCGVATD